MTFAVTVLYLQPEAPEVFDAYYEATHAPLVLEVPGLLSFTALRPGPGPDGGTPVEYLVATLTFEDRASFAAAMGSPEGRAMAADVASFATGGVTMLVGELRTYA